MLYFLTVEAKDAEVKNLLEKKDLNLEEMKKRLKDQERERQSELLKLQMEVNRKLHFTLTVWLESFSCRMLYFNQVYID